MNSPIAIHVTTPGPAHRLRYRNVWDRDEYYADRKHIQELRSVKIRDRVYRVRAEPVSIEYQDMSHTYTATSTHYFIKEKAFGIMVEFDLKTLVDKIPVYATHYTVRPE